MKSKILISAFFIAISGQVYSQEKSSGVASKSGSASGSGRRAIRQMSHFKQPEVVSTSSNGTRFLRKKYLRIIGSENAGFSTGGSFYRKKRENDGFATNGYKYKPNRKKGIR